MKIEVRCLHETLCRVFPISSQLCHNHEAADITRQDEEVAAEVDHSEDGDADPNIFGDEIPKMFDHQNQKETVESNVCQVKEPFLSFSLKHVFPYHDNAGDVGNHDNKEYVHNSALEQDSANTVKAEVVEDVDTAKWYFNNQNQSETKHGLSLLQNSDPSKTNRRKVAYSKLNKMETHSKQSVSDKEQQKYQCPKCSKTFRHQSSRSRHMSSHFGFKPYKCGVCGKSFLKKTALAIHGNIHSVEKTFKCTICAEIYKTKRALYRHMPRHDAELCNVNIHHQPCIETTPCTLHC